MTDSTGNVTGKRIILEIVREMRDGLHPLLYSRVAPGLYCVYLHPEDFSKLEGLVPRIRVEAQRALTEEMRQLNDAAQPQGRRWFVAAAEPAPPIEVPAQGWDIQIEPDRDEEVAAGTFVILSRLTLPSLRQFEGGASTTKVFKTVVSGETRTKTEQVFKTPPAPPPPPVAVAPPMPMPMPMPAPAPASTPRSEQAPPPVVAASGMFSTAVLPTGDRTARTLAQITVEDARGARLFVMDKPDIKIGRGGQFRLVDLQLEGPTRISRVHARIRRDDQGRFFIKDLSEWGTTVNGQRIARGVIKEGDEIREIDVEAELPARARIGLADTLFLEFAAAEQTTAIFDSNAGAAV
jgi:pSer/pThr/pTyr-binding forkhead associated (FHA) protein